jgi:hypothetical protein
MSGANIERAKLRFTLMVVTAFSATYPLAGARLFVTVAA